MSSPVEYEADRIESMLEFIQSSDEDDQEKADDEERILRGAFTQTEDGPQALRIILHDLYAMEVVRTETQMVLHNYAMVLLRKLGVLDRDGANQNAIDALLRRRNL